MFDLGFEDLLDFDVRFGFLIHASLGLQLDVCPPPALAGIGRLPGLQIDRVRANGNEVELSTGWRKGRQGRGELFGSDAFAANRWW